MSDDWEWDEEERPDVEDDSVYGISGWEEEDWSADLADNLDLQREPFAYMCLRRTSLHLRSRRESSLTEGRRLR
jgi:hypothetical protein